MKAKRHHLISTVALSALLALPAAIAIAADGDGPKKLAQANVASQQPAPVTQAPTAQAVSAEERQRWIPTANQFNVPGNAAFGRVATP